MRDKPFAAFGIRQRGDLSLEIDSEYEIPDPKKGKAGRPKKRGLDDVNDEELTRALKTLYAHNGQKPFKWQQVLDGLRDTLKPEVAYDSLRQDASNRLLGAALLRTNRGPGTNSADVRYWLGSNINKYTPF